jgi:hypothetical protein
VADRKTVVQVKCRLRRSLLRRIERSAETKDRSVNEEIEERLKESFQREKRAELVLEAIDRTLKILGISTDPATWSPEMRAWAAQQPGLLGRAGQSASEQPATDKKEDSK